MKKKMEGYIFTNDDTGGKTLFEHTATGIVRYYECCMNIPDGYYTVTLNKKGKVDSCWRTRTKPLTALQVQDSFRYLESKFKTSFE